MLELALFLSETTSANDLCGQVELDVNWSASVLALGMDFFAVFLYSGQSL